MKIKFTNSFTKEYDTLSGEMKDRVDKALEILELNPKHPGLRVKKMKGHKNIWEARISKDYRMTFELKKDTFYMRRVGPHEVEDKP